MEKQQIDGMDKSLKTLVEDALNKQHEEMMKQFLEIIGKKEAHASQSNPKFGRQTPFKVQVNFDIPNFQGKIDVDVVDDWLSKLERYFCVNNISDIEKITFTLLKVENHVKLAWEAHSTTKENQEAQDECKFFVMIDGKPTCKEFLEHVKYLLLQSL